MWVVTLPVLESCAPREAKKSVVTPKAMQFKGTSEGTESDQVHTGAGMPPQQRRLGYRSFPEWARQVEDRGMCREAGLQKRAEVRLSALSLRSSQAELSCWSWVRWHQPIPAEEGTPFLSVHLAALPIPIPARPPASILPNDAETLTSLSLCVLSVV